MTEAVLCKATLRTRFADQKDCIFKIPHNCFFDNRKLQIGDAALQLNGYRWGNRFYLKSSSDLKACSIPYDELSKMLDNYCIVFTSSQQHDLIAHLAMTGSSIRIGEICAAETPSFRLAVCKALSVSYDHCWAVLDLNAMENLGGPWGLTLSRRRDD